MRSKIFQEVLVETPKHVEIFIDLYADLIVTVNKIIEEKNIIVSEDNENTSEIFIWLQGKSDLTLRSISKLSAQLGVNLLSVKK